ncbi:MAG: hypothetical protein AAB354_09960 [candidate division KSB1 bacterium]
MNKTRLVAPLFSSLLSFSLLAQTSMSESPASAAQSPFELRWQFDTGG